MGMDMATVKARGATKQRDLKKAPANRRGLFLGSRVKQKADNRRLGQG